jgi:hypothetical protein
VADPFMQAVKALIATRERDPEWRRMRPPLVGLAEVRAQALAARFEAAQQA